MEKFLKSKTGELVDDWLAAIPVVRDPEQRNMHYRQFNTGITSMSVFTGDDMIALLQQLPYVVGTGTGMAHICIIMHLNAY